MAKLSIILLLAIVVLVGGTLGLWLWWPHGDHLQVIQETGVFQDRRRAFQCAIFHQHSVAVNARFSSLSELFCCLEHIDYLLAGGLRVNFLIEVGELDRTKREATRELSGKGGREL